MFLLLFWTFFVSHHKCGVLFVLKWIQWLLHKYADTHTWISVGLDHIAISERKKWKWEKGARKFNLSSHFLALDHILILFIWHSQWWLNHLLFQSNFTFDKQFTTTRNHTTCEEEHFNYNNQRIEIIIGNESKFYKSYLWTAVSKQIINLLWWQMKSLVVFT